MYVNSEFQENWRLNPDWNYTTDELGIYLSCLLDGISYFKLSLCYMCPAGILHTSLPCCALEFIFSWRKRKERVKSCLWILRNYHIFLSTSTKLTRVSLWKVALECTGRQGFCFPADCTKSFDLLELELNLTRISVMSSTLLGSVVWSSHRLLLYFV